MELFLSLFFDDYGFLSVGMLVSCFIVLAILGAIFMSYTNNEEAGLLPTFISAFISGTALFLFVCLIVSVRSINPYEKIPASGTPIQKTNLKRCTVGKTVNLGNIKNIMTDCQEGDREQKFKAGIESLENKSALK